MARPTLSKHRFPDIAVIFGKPHGLSPPGLSGQAARLTLTKPQQGAAAVASSVRHIFPALAQKKAASLSRRGRKLKAGRALVVPDSGDGGQLRRPPHRSYSRQTALALISNGLLSVMLAWHSAQGRSRRPNHRDGCFLGRSEACFCELISQPANEIVPGGGG